MATPIKNPAGCGSVKISGCTQRVCRCLQLYATSNGTCPNFEITKTIELTISDPANEYFAWSTSFSVECLVPPPPPHCEARTHTFLLECDHGVWKGYLNDEEMFKGTSQCNPMDMAFEIGTPLDCVANAVNVFITDTPD